MSDTKDNNTKTAHAAISEEKVLALLAQADYSIGLNTTEIHNHIAATTKMLRDLINKLGEKTEQADDDSDRLSNDQLTPVELANTIFDIALERIQQNVAISLLDLERLVVLANEVVNEPCSMASDEDKKRKIDSGVGVVKIVAWGAPILKANLDIIAASQKLVESAATVFDDFSNFIDQLENDLTEILGEVYALKENASKDSASEDSDSKESSTTLDNIHIVLVSNLKKLSDMRSMVYSSQDITQLEEPAENPFDYASQVLEQATRSILDTVAECKTYIDFVESQVKFLEPSVQRGERSFNAQQKQIGLKIALDTAINVPLICTNLSKIDKEHALIKFSSGVFSEGYSSLQEIQSSLSQICRDESRDRSGLPPLI